MQIRFDPGVLADMEAAADYYDAQQAGLGDEFLTELYSSCNFLAHNPLAAQQFDSVVRRKPLKRFPYMLYYFLDVNDTLGIVAVLHQSQNPAILAERKPSE